jgi:autotransporter-associated beta strand protein
LSPVNVNGQSLGINVYQGTLTLDVNIKNTGSNFVKTGPGTLIMNKASTAYTGATYLLQGATRMADIVCVGNGQRDCQCRGRPRIEQRHHGGGKALSIAGTGISNGGALRNQSGSNTYGGAITIGASGARINSDAGLLTLTGGIATTLTQDVTFGGAGNTTVSTTGISGSGSVIKDGAGTLTLNAANTYTGATSINDGTLAVAGSGAINGTSGVTIASGGTFLYNSSVPYTGGAIDNQGGTIGGTGRIGATVTLDSTDAILAPGNSPGIQEYSVSQSWASFTYEWDIDDFAGTTAGTDYDQIQFIDGAALTLTGTALPAVTSWNCSRWKASTRRVPWLISPKRRLPGTFSPLPAASPGSMPPTGLSIRVASPAARLGSAPGVLPKSAMIWFLPMPKSPNPRL